MTLSGKNLAAALKPDTHAKALVYIFLTGLAFRLWGVTHPLLDFHSWRQTLTATIAKNFYAGDMNILHPATNWAVEYYEFEFQIYPFLVALLYRVFGFHDMIGRAVSIAFSLGSMGMLYLLAKRYFDKTTAAFAIGCFALLPMSIYYTRAFMPESAMLFFSIAMVHYFTRWLDTQRWRDFFWAALFTTLTFLIKLPALYMGGPLLFLAALKFRSRIFTQFPAYLFLVLTLAPPILWYGHMADLHAQAHGGESIWLGNDKLANQQILLDYRFYKLIFWTRLVEKMFAFTAFPLLVLGFAARVDRKEQAVFHVWFFCVCAYFLIAAVGNKVHEYYQLPIIPPGCVFVGRFLRNFFAEDKNRLKGKPDFKTGLVLLMILFIPLHSVYKLNKRLRYSTDYIAIGATLKENTPKDALVLLQDIGSGRPHVFYYAERKGWTLGWVPKLGPDEIKNFMARGATYYGVVKLDLQKANRKLYDYLANRHRLAARNDLFTLFELQGKPSIPMN
ncbi:MAG: ArnT family glycosyltransferase [Nitrospinaceae bacterium]